MPRSVRAKKRARAKARSGAAPNTQHTLALNPQEQVLTMQRTAGNRAVSDLLETREGKPHTVENVPPVVDAALEQDPGRPLEPDLRSALESALDADFSKVRVHDDALAAQSADTVNALAYTSGQDIVFGAGQFAPDTVKGRELLMHEAAHVVEHRSTGGRAAREGARSPAISRAPKPGTADPPSLFAASIPAPSMIQVGSSMLVTIYFGHNNFLLDTRNFEAVTQLQEKLRFMFKPDVNVDGFASGEGTPANNLRLSDMRRQSVIAILRQASKDLQFGGTAHGASDPVEQETATVPAELEQQRARNRRVTIFIIGSSAPAKPEEKKPIKIFSPRLKDLPEETDSERLDRLLKERSRLPSLKRPKISLSDKFWENVDDTVDRVTKKITNNKKIRELIKDGVHKAIEKGSEEILDRALDETSLDKSAKEAIKSGLKAGIKFEF